MTDEQLQRERDERYEAIDRVIDKAKEDASEGPENGIAMKTLAPSHTAPMLDSRRISMIYTACINCTRR